MRDSILIVDDVEINRDLLEEILEDEYTIIKAKDGIEGIELYTEHIDELAAVLLDLRMPNMDGEEVLEKMADMGTLAKVPVLVISSEDSLASEKECFELGVSDFIHKPFDDQLVRTRVNNVASLYMYKEHLEETIEEQLQTIHARNANLIDFIGSVVESRSVESGDHVRRVKAYTKIMAEEMMESYPEYGITEHDVKIISRASALHDLGKIAIPDNILLKPGRFTEEEFEIMKTHSMEGAKLVEHMKNMWDEDYQKASYDICRHHHERYDGKGYPDGLKGEEIPISAQLVSIADVYDALISKRCYKDPFSKANAFQMIINGECGQFSPKIIDCFERRIDDFEKIADMQMSAF